MRIQAQKGLVQMDKVNSESSESIGSVKAAIGFYRGRIHGEKPEKYKTHIPFPKDSPSKTRDLHLAKFDIGRFNASKEFVEKEKAEAESELVIASTAAKQLALHIEESNAEARARTLELQSLKKSERRKEGRAVLVAEMNNHLYVDVVRELDTVKQDLSRLKLDVASALEAKAKAENVIKASSSRATSYLSSLEKLRKEVEEANEEQVLVELAKIEATREYREIEAQRDADAVQVSNSMEKTIRRIEDLHKELSHVKELEMKLEITTSEVNVMQNELEFVRTMENNLQNNHSTEDAHKRREGKSETSSLQRSAEAELKAAREELASIKEEGFQFMTSMDLVREELKHIAEETERLKKVEKKAESTAQNLNSKLLQAKSKLESISTADERAKSIVSNLSAALQQLQTEIEGAKKEKELISEETRSMKMEIEKTDLNIDLAEERLEAAMQELGKVKASEEIAVNKLRTQTERTKRARASSSLQSSTLTITKFEYDYLSKRAEAAEDVADKKIAAAHAWIEASKAGEREILMKTERAEREIREVRVVKEQELYRTEKSVIAKREAEGELYNRKQKQREPEPADLQLAVVTPRKSIRENGIPGASRKARIRRLPVSPRSRPISRSPSFTIRKKEKAMPNLVKFLKGQQIGKQSEMQDV